MLNIEGFVVGAGSDDYNLEGSGNHIDIDWGRRLQRHANGAEVTHQLDVFRWALTVLPCISISTVHWCYHLPAAESAGG